MDKKEINKANRKALPAFLLIICLSLLVGGALGWVIAESGGFGSADGLRRAADWFGERLAPWLMVLCAVAEAAVCVPLYIQGKRLLAGWDGEDEEVCDRAERKLNWVLWVSNCAYIVSFFLLAAAYGSNSVAELVDGKSLALFFVSVAAFLAVLVETLVFQQRAVDAAKRSNPEKTVSYYDAKFQKKWLDSCDEAEKLVIGKCAYRAFAATNKVCLVLAGVLAVGALLFRMGFAASLAVCVIWMVNQAVYFRECMRYSKAGSRIS